MEFDSLKVFVTDYERFTVSLWSALFDENEYRHEWDSEEFHVGEQSIFQAKKYAKSYDATNSSQKLLFEISIDQLKYL